MHLFVAKLVLLAQIVEGVMATLAAFWRTLPVLCSHCGYAVDVSALGEGEQVAWCPNCKTVFQIPILRIPGWVGGVICLLLIKLQAGI